MRLRRLNGVPTIPLRPWPPRFAATDDETISVAPKTALAGLGIWVLGGVLTHVAVRLVDKWFFKGG